MPDDQDYANLADLLARAEQWSATDVQIARSARRSQAEAAATFDQRDQARVAEMWAVVGQIDQALARWQAAH